LAPSAWLTKSIANPVAVLMPMACSACAAVNLMALAATAAAPTDAHEPIPWNPFRLPPSAMPIAAPMRQQTSWPSVRAAR
jgi:hypothetical protein